MDIWVGFYKLIEHRCTDYKISSETLCRKGRDEYLS